TVVEQLKKVNEQLTTQKVLLQEQLKEKQKEVEELRERLETPVEPTLSELDDSLMARHQGLKVWFNQYQKNQVLETELAQNIDEVSDELVNQDEKISQLRGELGRLKREKQSLEKDLALSQKLAELRKTPYLPNENWDALKYALYSLAVAVF